MLFELLLRIILLLVHNEATIELLAVKLAVDTPMVARLLLLLGVPVQTVLRAPHCLRGLYSALLGTISRPRSFAFLSGFA